jgi:hypothetical protein
VSFERELRECLEAVVGDEVPEPEYDALVFFKQWLAERNLGLVPIAGANAFEWPGHWIARVRARGDDHAVVMFGSPSGPLHDPAGALAGGGTIVEGWLVARLSTSGFRQSSPTVTARPSGRSWGCSSLPTRSSLSSASAP